MKPVIVLNYGSYKRLMQWAIEYQNSGKLEQAVSEGVYVSIIEGRILLKNNIVPGINQYYLTDFIVDRKGVIHCEFYVAKDYDLDHEDILIGNKAKVASYSIESDFSYFDEKSYVKVPNIDIEKVINMYGLLPLALNYYLYLEESENVYVDSSENPRVSSSFTKQENKSASLTSLSKIKRIYSFKPVKQNKINAERNYTKESWFVPGHKRIYKSGKIVFIKPKYHKRRKPLSIPEQKPTIFNFKMKGE